MTEIKVLNKMTAVPEETPVINVSMSNAAYQGPPGYTPIKGIDYFTEDEKNEIIEAAKVGASSAADISYDNSENQVENVETVQKALDFLFDNSLDEIAIENILIEKNYQNKGQVDEAISEAIENIDIPETDLTGYATEKYVNDAIENIDIPEVDLTGYATQTYVKDLVRDIPAKKGTGSSSMIVGAGATASGNHSIAIGTGSQSSGLGSVAIMGKAAVDYSIAIGPTTTSDKKYQIAIGKFNKPDANANFIIGNGITISDKRNAMTIDDDNIVHFPGSVKVGETDAEVATKAYVDEVLGVIENGTY